MKRLAIILIRGYQRLVSPFLGGRCRFYPSCSEYAVQSVEQRGLCLGLFLAFVRLLKCHPGHPGGVDLVPLEKGSR